MNGTSGSLIGIQEKSPPTEGIPVKKPELEFHPALPLPCLKCGRGYYAGVSSESVCTACGTTLSDYEVYCRDNFIEVLHSQHGAWKEDNESLRRLMRLRHLTSLGKLVLCIAGSLAVAYVATVVYRRLFPFGPSWLALLLAVLVASPTALLLIVACWRKGVARALSPFGFGDSFHCGCCGTEFHVPWRDNSMSLGTAICPKCRRLVTCTDQDEDG